MNRIPCIRVNPSSSHVRAIVVLFMAHAIGLSYFADDGAEARAEVTTPNYDGAAGRFPVPNGKYKSTNTTAFPSAPLPIEILGMKLLGPADAGATIPLPSSPAMDPIVVDTPLTVAVSIRPAPGALRELFRRLPDDHYRIYLIEDGAERLILEFQGLPGADGLILAGELVGGQPLLIRESPTLPSLGEHLVSPLPGDTYRIESFLEVWTEISLDGGTTFYPADASLRLELTQIVPEPTTLLLLVLGLSMMNARRRAAMP